MKCNMNLYIHFKYEAIHNVLTSIIIPQKDTTNICICLLNWDKFIYMLQAKYCFLCLYSSTKSTSLLFVNMICFPLKLHYLWCKRGQIIYIIISMGYQIFYTVPIPWTTLSAAIKIEIRPWKAQFVSLHQTTPI